MKLHIEAFFLFSLNVHYIKVVCIKLYILNEIYFMLCDGFFLQKAIFGKKKKKIGFVRMCSTGFVTRALQEIKLNSTDT
jgi:hypothetical protein